jgi:hypothetical protein
MPGKKMPMKPRIAPTMVGVEPGAEAMLRAPRYTAKLKLGPGKAWIIAKPRRKSRGETQPGSTT